jgi:hypothetical protein
VTPVDVPAACFQFAWDYQVAGEELLKPIAYHPDRSILAPDVM